MSVTFLIFVMGWLVFAAATVATLWAGYLFTQDHWLEEHDEQLEVTDNLDVVHTGVDDLPAR
jgi:sensor domain CHASE-containing protein